MNPHSLPRRRLIGTAAAGLALMPLLTACAGGTDDLALTGTRIENCGTSVDFPSPARRLFVNDSNMISMVLALGAEQQVAAVSSLSRDRAVLSKHYGDAVGRLDEVSTEYPPLETVVAARPDVVVAGWNYGYDQTKNLTPATLRERGIAAYTLTESCRQGDGAARGVEEPWTALEEDLRNLGAITGRRERAAEVVDDLEARLAALRQAPRAARPPVVLVFDSGRSAVFTSGSFGAPQAVIEAGGGINAMADLADTWTEVSWERVATTKPDAVVFVDYPGQTYEEKVAVLRANPATRDLTAVREGRFLNLPYAMWTSGPLNIDAAEEVRTALEDWGLVPQG